MTGFEGGRLQSADPAAPIQGGRRVIPRQENTFQIGGPKKYNPNRHALRHPCMHACMGLTSSGSPQHQCHVQCL